MTKRGSDFSSPRRRRGPSAGRVGWLLAIGLAGAGVGGGISFFRDRKEATPPVVDDVRTAQPPAATSSFPAVEAAVASTPAPLERTRPAREEVAEPPPRATAAAAVATAPDVVPTGADALMLPAAAIPPDPAWRLDSDRMAEFERLGRDFLSATTSSPETAEQLRRQWTEARSASDAQFEQMFGTELRDAQQHRAVVGPAAPDR